MHKAEFLKQAKAKLKTQNEKFWVSEMNFIYSATEILRVGFNVEESEYSHRWCIVETLPNIENLNKALNESSTTANYKWN